ncbi:MAG TPA: site-specific integrase [Candidatus Babeliaceae bacterium]|nr:site-specific integrase [Candidatus Babeliaceae bacterium]
MDLSGNSSPEKIRELFLIGCYTGLRYSDYSTLTTDKIKGGFIRGIQIKTGDPVTIPLHDAVIRILKKYPNGLPKSSSNQKTNKYLKDVGKEIPRLKAEIEKQFAKAGEKKRVKFKKWELLTTHTARRSLATNALLESTPTLTIMAITGHKTEKAFLKYKKLSSADYAKLLKEQWALRKKKSSPAKSAKSND